MKNARIGDIVGHYQLSVIRYQLFFLFTVSLTQQHPVNRQTLAHSFSSCHN
ncbi:MAG: hypothetical protein ACPG8W_22495 [Candidatus Promineifilaceae bacterium]